MATFDECGVRWLAASSVSNFCENPAYWVTKHLYGGREAPLVPAIARSNAVYRGVKNFLFGADLNGAADFALGEYELNFGHHLESPEDPAARKEHDAILPMLDGACKCFVELDLRRQPRISRMFSTVWLDGISVPFVTVPDFVFEDCIVDLKTTHRLPSKPTLRHLRNAALHRLHRGLPVIIVYVTMQKSAVYHVAAEDVVDSLQALRLDALALQNFLGQVSSPDEAIAMTPLREEHYLWTPELLGIAMSKCPQLPATEIMHALTHARDQQLCGSASRSPSGGLLPDYRSWDPDSEL